MKPKHAGGIGALISALLVPQEAFADLLFFDTTGRFAGTYVCEAQAGGGVVRNASRDGWTGTAFSVDDDGTILVKVEAVGEERWESFGYDDVAMMYSVNIKTLGSSRGEYCRRINNGYGPLLDWPPKVIIGSDGALSCTIVSGTRSLLFGLDDLRFVDMFTAGYQSGIDGGGTPFLKVGVCSKAE